MQQKSRSSTDFLTAFSTLISNARLGSVLRCHGPAKRSPAKVPASCIVRALVFHLLRGMGTLSENLQLLHQETLSPSSMSERRANLPWKVFQMIMGTALRPQAREEKHPMAFYKHWLLVAIDGTQFSVTNTPQILSSLSKASARRMKAAFGKRPGLDPSRPHPAHEPADRHGRENPAQRDGPDRGRHRRSRKGTRLRLSGITQT